MLKYAEGFAIAGMYDEADWRYLSALSVLRLELDIKEFGPDDPKVSEDIELIAELYFKQEINVEAAERLHRKAFDIKEKYFGENNVSVLADRHNLAVFYWEKCNYKESEALVIKNLPHHKTDVAFGICKFSRYKLTW